MPSPETVTLPRTTSPSVSKTRKVVARLALVEDGRRIGVILVDLVAGKDHVDALRDIEKVAALAAIAVRLEKQGMLALLKSARVQVELEWSRAVRGEPKAVYKEVDAAHLAVGVGP